MRRYGSKMKQKVIALVVNPGMVTFGGEEIQMKLPKGCTGITLIFESKKTAREWYGKDVRLLEIEEFDSEEA